MTELSRRSILGGAVGAIGGLSLSGCVPGSSSRPPVTASPIRPAHAVTGVVARENLAAGSSDWQTTARGLRSNLDAVGQIQGFASSTSVMAGERIAFHVSTGKPQDFTVTVHRLGHYGGSGGRLMATSPTLMGVRQPHPETVPGTGALHCPGWTPSWSMEVPQSWLSGLYLASFTTADGYRSAAPFVVRDDRQPDFLVIVPFATYQAYNNYPFDGKVGRSLYYGFVNGPKAPQMSQPAPDGEVYAAGAGLHISSGMKYWQYYPTRARTVSFRRPYADDGVPRLFDLDHSFARWAESQGLDVGYATSVDLDEGRVKPGLHSALLFSGHDEYWSQPMRDATERALGRGSSLGFFAANNVYWKTRMQRDPAGFSTMTCFKTDPDPGHRGLDRTTTWRDLGANHVVAESRLLGTMYIGLIPGRLPMVIKEPGHWFWSGTDLVAGDRIPGLVCGELDGVARGMPKPAGASDAALLSASPFPWHGRPKLQQTSWYTAASGGMVFNAGTFGWSAALGGQGTQLPQVQRATANLLARMRA